MPDYRLGKLKGEFVAVWYEGGKRCRVRLGTQNPAEARAELQLLIRDHEQSAKPREGLTVADVWEAYIGEKEAQGKPVARLRDAWKALRGTFETLGPGDVSMAVGRDYTARRRRSVSDGTIHTELGYLRAAMRLAAKQGRITVAPSFDLPSKPRPKSRFLTPPEARSLINATAMPHMRLYVLLALHTAGRPSSILDLEWDRVDLAGGKIHLDNPSRDRTAKGRATVPMAPALRPYLEAAQKAALTGHVIEWAGQPVRSIKKGFAEACRRAGLASVTPYVLRHTAARWMAEGGVPMREISQYLGHTSTGVTERVYARFSPEHLKDASNVISTVLLGPTEPEQGPEGEPKETK